MNKRLFGSDTIKDLTNKSAYAAIAHDKNIDPRIKSVISEDKTLTHAYDFYNFSNNKESEIIDDLLEKKNLLHFLNTKFKKDYIRDRLISKYGNITHIDKKLNSLRSHLNAQVTSIISNVGRKNELSADLEDIGSINRNMYNKYHSKTVAIDDVKGLEENVLDMGNYEQHRINDILNKKADFKKESTIFDKTLGEIINDMISFYVDIPDKYNKYYISLDQENVVAKHIMSSVLIIIDRDNSIYFGILLLIISIILYAINIIQV
tara:strand:- start:1312 stop:2100 length:789 start_codon:yes stop_codon:yes gene_type:complete